MKAAVLGKPIAHSDFAARIQYIDSDGSSSPSLVSHATSVTGQIASSGAAQPNAKHEQRRRGDGTER